MQNELRLAELLCTKFCHDIIGPVGAINNGMEFLAEEMPDLDSQATDLIANSSKEAIARIEFYRQAYGQNTSDSSVSITSMKELSEKFFSQSKVNLIWSNEYTDISAVNITSVQKKLTLNLLIIASAALIRGGDLEFRIEDDMINITVNGPTIKIDDIIKDYLEGKVNSDNLDPRVVHLYYTYLLAQMAATKVSIQNNESHASFKFKL